MVAVFRLQPMRVALRPMSVGQRSAMTTSHESQWGPLMVAAHEGNGGAYRRLLDELRSWLVRYYGRRLPSGQVDDAVQDTLIAIHEKRHTYDPERPFKPWLAAIARHKWIDQLRAMGRVGAQELVDEIAIDDHESAVMSETILGRLLAELKPAQAEAIRLVKLEGYSIEEASQRTGQSNSLIKVNIHRGLTRLTAIVQRHAHVD